MTWAYYARSWPNLSYPDQPFYQRFEDRGGANLRWALPTGDSMNLDRLVGRYVMVNSYPSAWHGVLTRFEPAGGGWLVELADCAMWTSADVAEVVIPGKKAKRLPAWTGRVAYVHAGAVQEAGWLEEPYPEDGSLHPRAVDSLAGLNPDDGTKARRAKAG